MEPAALLTKALQFPIYQCLCCMAVLLAASIPAKVGLLLVKSSRAPFDPASTFIFDKLDARSLWAAGLSY